MLTIFYRMLSKSLKNSLSYGIFFYKFCKKARVYYTLSIARGGGRPPAPPGFATDYMYDAMLHYFSKFCHEGG